VMRAIFFIDCGILAQWLERKPDKLEVDGSIPSYPTSNSRKRIQVTNAVRITSIPTLK
jgi:hypothetical protein